MPKGSTTHSLNKELLLWVTYKGTQPQIFLHYWKESQRTALECMIILIVYLIFKNNPIIHPYNLVQLNNHESKLEIALAGFKKNEVKVYTEFGKLYVEGKKEESKDVGEFVHKGLAQRSFQRVWTITDDTEVGSVSFDDGLLVVDLNKIVPEHHTRKDYL